MSFTAYEKKLLFRILIRIANFLFVLGIKSVYKIKAVDVENDYANIVKGKSELDGLCREVKNLPEGK